MDGRGNLSPEAVSMQKFLERKKFYRNICQSSRNEAEENKGFGEHGQLKEVEGLVVERKRAGGSKRVWVSEDVCRALSR